MKQNELPATSPKKGNTFLNFFKIKNEGFNVNISGDTSEAGERFEHQSLNFLHSGEYLCTKLWWKYIYLCKGKHKMQAESDNS